MSISNCEVVTNNVQSLPDNPTVSSSELKAKFDKTGDDLKKYINESLIPNINEELNIINEALNSTLLREYRNDIKLAIELEANTEFRIPTSYKVGSNNLKVFYEGNLLTVDKHYVEVGTGESSIIKFGWKLPQNSNLTFIVRK